MDVHFLQFWSLSRSLLESSLRLARTESYDKDPPHEMEPSNDDDMMLLWVQAMGHSISACRGTTRPMYSGASCSSSDTPAGDV